MRITFVLFFIHLLIFTFGQPHSTSFKTPGNKMQFYFENKLVSSYKEARSYCRKVGADVGVIASKEDLSRIVSSIKIIKGTISPSHNVVEFNNYHGILYHKAIVVERKGGQNSSASLPPKFLVYCISYLVAYIYPSITTTRSMRYTSCGPPVYLTKMGESREVPFPTVHQGNLPACF